MANFLKLVQSTVEEIELHLTEKISVASVCRNSYVSSFYLQRIFRAYTGESIGNYLRRRRLSLAMAELQKTDQSVLTIALKYGFGSSEAFSRACKSYFGASPLYLRKSIARTVPPHKKSLSRRELEFLERYACVKPAIRTLKTFKVVGKSGSFESPLTATHKYMKGADQIWKSFYPKFIPQFRRAEQGFLVGVMQGSYAEPVTSYLAGCRTKRKLSTFVGDLAEINVSGGWYAVFQYYGYHEQTQYMINYIYSTWLPSSGYFRREGSDFTILDCRKQPPNPKDSAIKYLVPVVKRK